VVHPAFIYNALAYSSALLFQGKRKNRQKRTAILLAVFEPSAWSDSESATRGNGRYRTLNQDEWFRL